MSDVETSLPTAPGIISRNESAREARLEAAEAHKYLMAKSFFDCREYDRCAAVFLPPSQLNTPLADSSSSTSFTSKPKKPASSANGKGRAPRVTGPVHTDELPVMSQKALFLALYAKYMSGEKRKDEESEMILGPADGGATMNRELVDITRLLKRRLKQLEERREDGQGWLQYLYGIVLAKGKSTEEAKRWLLKSVSMYAYNWGAWQELGSLVGTVDEVSDDSQTFPVSMAC